MTHAEEEDCPDTLRVPYSRENPETLQGEDDRQAFLDALIARHQQ